jgi:RNA polymerase sigma-70 factor (ECF subfamily)
MTQSKELAGLGAGLDPPRAEDLAQETFKTFLETSSRFEGRSHVRTWIFGIFYHKLAESRRGLRREAEVDDIDEIFESRFRKDGSWARPPCAPLREVLDAELGEEIADCLAQAPEKQRLAFQLREGESLSTEAICKIREVSVTNLGVMLHRLRNRMRECLEAKGMLG